MLDNLDPRALATLVLAIVLGLVLNSRRKSKAMMGAFTRPQVVQLKTDKTPAQVAADSAGARWRYGCLTIIALLLLLLICNVIGVVNLDGIPVAIEALFG